MKKLMILTTAALIAGTTFAMAQAAAAAASRRRPPTPILRPRSACTPGESNSAPAQGMQAPPASSGMNRRTPECRRTTRPAT